MTSTTTPVIFATTASMTSVGFVKLEKINCPECGKKINRDAYPFHMKAVHAVDVK